MRHYEMIEDELLIPEDRLNRVAFGVGFFSGRKNHHAVGFDGRL